MLAQLRRHPFSVKAHFRHSVVLTYAVAPDSLKEFVPAGLELDGYKGFGLLAVAMVQTSHLRPAVFPAALGRDFFLVGYRVFVKYRNRAGKTFRGLRIIRSYTNRLLMVAAGNLLTHYNYRFAAVQFDDRKQSLYIATTTRDHEADLDVVVDLSSNVSSLPTGSPFESMKDARRFAGPLPFTFDHESETDSIVIIEGKRQNWNPRPVQVHVHRNEFINRFMHNGTAPVLANAFYVDNVDYCWLRGRREPLDGKSDE